MSLPCVSDDRDWCADVADVDWGEFAEFVVPLEPIATFVCKATWAPLPPPSWDD